MSDSIPTSTAEHEGDTTPAPTPAPRGVAANAQAYLAAIVGSSDDAIISKDLNGIIQSVNAAAERMFGYRGDELIGQNIRILIPPERQDEEDVILARIRRGERVDHFETVRVAKDGRRMDMSLTVSPVLDEAGTVIGVSKIARNITEQKRAIAERDRLLEAERAARAEAERASRVKDEFLAMVSHELRTPLNAILSWTELMVRGRDDPKILERGLDVVARNTRLQAQLISDLLDISRIVAGKLRLENQDVDMASIVSDAIDTVRHAAAAKQIAITTSLDASRPIAGDPARLQQVVWNLLSNAVKFTPEGGHISVTLREIQTHAIVTVTDDGTGIAPEFLPLRVRSIPPGGPVDDSPVRRPRAGPRDREAPGGVARRHRARGQRRTGARRVVHRRNSRDPGWPREPDRRGSAAET